MNLDKRFKVLPFCCFGTDKKAITNHIGKKGYFANRISCFSDINLCKYGTLGTVLGDQQECFYMNETDDTFSFFIPEYFVKPKEKKYRPFTLKEFLDKFPMLTTITMRKKGDNDCIITCTLTGYRNRLICTDICLGVEWVSLGTLADEYEYQYMYSKIWEPFGVEE